MSDLTGQSIGRYHIISVLGEGGMATVYKAFDTRLECDVAIKFIRHGQIGTDNLEIILQRFEREAKRMAKFNHPNIVRVSDFGEYEGFPFLVMPYLTGGTLKDYIRAQGGKPIPFQEAARILAPVARALEYAHEQGTIHRDVKPSNILLTAKGQPLLADFGVAKILDLDDGLTQAGTAMGLGTPKYMAPEQWDNKVTVQTDVYSLGVVFYEMVTGRVPFIAETPAALMLKQATERPPRPRTLNPKLTQTVEHVIYTALAKDPMGRYADMGQFAQALENLAVNSGYLREMKEDVRREPKEERSNWIRGSLLVTLVLLFIICVLAGGGIWFARQTSQKSDGIPQDSIHLTLTQIERDVMRSLTQTAAVPRAQNTGTPTPASRNTVVSTLPSLTLVPPLVSKKNTGTTISPVNVRKGPGTTYDTIAGISENIEVELTGRNPNGEWFYCKTEDGVEGWVSADFIQRNGQDSDIPYKNDAPPALKILVKTGVPNATPASDQSPTPTMTVTRQVNCFSLSTSIIPEGYGSIQVITAANCGAKYIAGTTISLSAKPDTGNFFMYWEGSVSGSSAEVSFVIEGDSSVTALFDQDVPQ